MGPKLIDGIARHRAETAQQRTRPASGVRDRVREHLEQAHLAAGLEAFLHGDGLARSRARLEVEQLLDESGPRRTVHQAVVDLPEQGHAAALQALDEVHLPQWAAPVQGACEQVARQLRKLLVAAG